MGGDITQDVQAVGPGGDGEFPGDQKSDRQKYYQTGKKAVADIVGSEYYLRNGLQFRLSEGECAGGYPVDKEGPKSQ